MTASHRDLTAEIKEVTGEDYPEDHDVSSIAKTLCGIERKKQEAKTDEELEAYYKGYLYATIKIVEG